MALQPGSDGNDLEQSRAAWHAASSPIAPRTASQDPVLDAIVEALRGVKYGQITITVQDGAVVQIDRMERRRLKS